MSSKSASHAEKLSVVLTQAVGSDGTALQKWTIHALKKKEEGDGENADFAVFLSRTLNKPRTCVRMHTVPTVCFVLVAL